MQHPTHHTRTATSLLIGVALLAVATVAAPASAQPSAEPSAKAPTQLTVGLGYIPHVQFAQFYLAKQAGYYRDAGLDVTFQNKIDPELITLLGQGALDIGMADGTSLIPAVSQGIPVRYGATIYAVFPNIVFAPAASGIKTAADLAGRRIGIPGRYGSSWIMLQALLASAGLTPDDVEIVLYPDFGQATAVAQGQVDAATGFVNNEPVQLERQGIDVTVLHIDAVAPLPGNGLVVGAPALDTKLDALQAFTAATLRAMEEISADPQVGLDAAFAQVPDLASDPEAQRAILDATIAAWSSPYTLAHGVGSIDPDTWRSAIAIMAGQPGSTTSADLTVDQLVTDQLLP